MTLQNMSIGEDAALLLMAKTEAEGGHIEMGATAGAQQLLTQVFSMCNPHTLLLLLIPVNLLTARGMKLKPSFGKIDLTKAALTLLLIAIHSMRTRHDDAWIFFQQSPDLNGYLSFMWSPTGTYLFVLGLTMMERPNHSNRKIPLFGFWCTTLVSTAEAVYKRESPVDVVTCVDTWFLDILQIGAVVVQCCLVFVGKSAARQKDQAETCSHPKSKAGLISDCLLNWTLGLLWTGSKRNLEEDDVCDLIEKDKCRNAVSTFELTWKIEEFKKDIEDEASPLVKVGQKEKKVKDSEDKKKSKDTEGSKKDKGDVPIRLSLFKVLVKTFGFKFLFLQFVKGMAELTHFVSPLLMGAFMEHIQNRHNEHWSKGIGLVFAIFAFNTANTIFQHRIWATICRFQKRIRSSVMMCVFKKALTLRNDCTKDITTGEIVNLISEDCDRVIDMSQHMFFIFSTPLMVGVSMYLLHSQVGNAMYAGLIIIILLIPLNKVVGDKLKNVHLAINENREKRSKLMNEIINGIKVLKLYAWEPSFIKKVHDIRDKENECNDVKSLMHGFIDCMFRAIPYLVKLGSFATYLLLGGHIDAAKGFTTMHLFHMLNHPFSLMALIIPGYVEATVSLKRINKFLNGDNIPHDIVVRRRKGESAITIDNGTFSWERDSLKPTLKDINVNIPKGSLVAVVGLVGCGKSSLLSAMLGEMEKEDGNVEVQGNVAYVPQEAWTLNATLRNNVLFGSPMDAQRYEKVVNACSLKQDFKLMAAGDRTEIEEKGINLSGGQKQRVSLARAVYNDADVYLLDDPLSAVDAHVGKHIFNHVIGHRGMLKGKTRVLVTHGVHWLPYVDSIIFIKDGAITETGTYEQLTSRDGSLAEFLKKVLSHKADSSFCKENKVNEKIMERLNSINSNGSGETVTCNDTSATSVNPSEEQSSPSSTDDSDGDSDWLQIDEKDDKSGVFVDEDDLEQGQVKKGIYLEYIRAVGYKLIFVFFLIFGLTSVFDVVNSNVLQAWTDDSLLSNVSMMGSDEYTETNWTYFKWFAITGAVEVISSFVYVAIIFKATFEAATRLHNHLLYKILRSPMSFFDTTPSCWIILRFTKDINRVDDFGGCLRGLICQFLNMCTFLTLVILYCPAVAIYLIPISVGYVLISRLHNGPLRQLRRIRSKYRSPMYQHFTETLNGRASIRAYKTQKSVIETMENRIDKCTNFELWEMWASIGFGMRNRFLALFVGLATGIISVMDPNMTAGMVGLVTMYAEAFSGTLGAFIRTISHAETELVSLEKVIEYSKKPSEAEWEKENNKPDLAWPSNGGISMDNYQTRYREGQDLVLKGINCNIQGGQKVGIVGRTGTGKSTLTQAFFRLLEAADGKILLDDEHIADLGLHDLRSRINILPQEPVVFSGSLRMNLDPFGRNTDEEIWKALRLSHLAPFVEGLPEQLNHECGEGGKNMSVGQRQLLCLARTLLKMSKVLVLDEATAAVDMETDELLQKTIRTEFKDCTVLSIAHRLNTVMDYDKIMVLESGLVKEFDSPANLLAENNSIFYSMAKDANLVE